MSQGGWALEGGLSSLGRPALSMAALGSNPLAFLGMDSDLDGPSACGLASPLGVGGAGGGVLDLPPLDPSVHTAMIRGDNGAVRWVTAANPSAQADDWREELAAALEGATHGGNTNDSYSDFGAGAAWRTPMTALMAEAEEIIAAQAAARRDRPDIFSQHQDISATLRSATAAPSAVGLPSAPPDAPAPPRVLPEQLWTSTYAPRRFADLLSDEACNLSLLRWMKAWDDYVFPARKADTACASSGGASFGAGADLGLHAAHLPPSRPEQRIVLITGPPGAGKTTMAHVIAHHCGYHPIEVNASVDRSASALERIIASTVANTRVLGSGGSGAGGAGTIAGAMMARPRCLIIDEIDGVVAAVIPLLLKQDVHRPVICLANDLYAPAIRELRLRAMSSAHPDAAVMQLPPIAPQRLLARLRVILLLEEDRAEARRRDGSGSNHLSGASARQGGLLAGPKLPLTQLVPQPMLQDMVHRSNGDVRTCLTTLQFLCNSAQAPSGPSGRPAAQSSADVYRLFTTACRKDTVMGAWSLWQQLFQRSEKHKYLSILQAHEDAAATPSASSASADTTAAAPGPSSAQSDLERALAGAAKERAEGLLSRFRAGDGAGRGGHGSRRVDPGFEYVFAHLLPTSGTTGDSAGAGGSAIGALDIGLVLDGCFEHFPKQRYSDYTLARTLSTVDAFCLTDILQTQAFSQHPALFGLAEQYALVTAATVFAFTSSLTKSDKVAFPRAETSLKTARKASAAVIKSFLAGESRPQRLLSCTSFALHAAEVVSADVAPLLCRCLLPPQHIKFPPHFTQLRTLLPKDQDTWHSVVRRHAAYDLTYRLHKGPGGASWQVGDRGGRDGPSPGAGGDGGPRPSFQQGGGAGGGGYGGGNGGGGGAAGGGADDRWSEYWALEPPIDRFCMAHITSHPKPYNPASSTATTTTGERAALPTATVASPVYAGTAAVTTKGILVGRSDVRQMIVGELATERVRAAAESKKLTEAAAASASPSRGARRDDPTADASASPSAAAKVPAAAVPLKAHAPPPPVPAAATAPVKVRKDFFGRPLPPLPAGNTSTSSSAHKVTAGNKRGREEPGDDPLHVSATTATSAPMTPEEKYPSSMRFAYFDGSTVGLKRGAIMSDFV